MSWLYRFDMDVFRVVHVGWHSQVLDPVFLLLSFSGLGIVQFLASLLFLRGRETKHYVLPLLVTILVAGLPVAQGIKHLTGRDRPSNLVYALPEEQVYGNSFPSGHTTTSFAVAFMLYLVTRGSRNEWMGTVAMIWAVLVGLSRIYLGVHWPTDVFAGACGGVFSACLVYLILRKLGHKLHLDHSTATLSGQEAARE